MCRGCRCTRTRAPESTHGAFDGRAYRLLLGEQAKACCGTAQGGGGGQGAGRLSPHASADINAALMAAAVETGVLRIMLCFKTQDVQLCMYCLQLVMSVTCEGMSYAQTLKPKKT